MIWTTERSQQLTADWAAGFSCSEIARRLGGVSRNAVIGKVRRLGLEFRNPNNAHNYAQRERSVRRARATPKHSKFNFARSRPPSERAMAAEAFDSHPPAADASLHPPLMIRLDQLEPKHCRFPIGDPLADGFGYCGHEHAGTDLPYCKFHHRLAYQPARKGRHYGQASSDQ